MLENQSARIATMLRRSGIGTGAPVLLLHPASAELYAVLIAIFRVGAVAMVVDLSAGRETLKAACAQLPPAALFCSGRGLLFAVVNASLRPIRFKLTSARFAPGGSRLADTAALPRSDRVAAVGGDAPALVTFTSGSTGAAKGAVRSHDVLGAQRIALGSVAAREGEVDVVSLPIVVLTNLAAGATSVIPDGDLSRPGAIAPGPVLAQIARAGAQRITGSPALVERLVSSASGAEAADATLWGVKIVTGGGPVFPDLVARATAVTGADLVAVYGSTEAEPIAHVSSAEVGAKEIAAMREGAGLIAGYPVRETLVRIIPTTWSDAADVEGLLRAGKQTAAGTRGEIVVSGRHVVPGYLHGLGDAETKIRVGAVVWHRTGDVGYLDDVGRLWLLGRVRATITDAHGELHPFAVECAARLILPGRRSVLVCHNGLRMLLVEGALVAGEREALRTGLRWAKLDRLIEGVRIPLDRRHNSKVDYSALAKLLNRVVPSAPA